MKTRNCQYCGALVKGVRNCPHCGAPIKKKIEKENHPKNYETTTKEADIVKRVDEKLRDKTMVITALLFFLVSIAILVFALFFRQSNFAIFLWVFAAGGFFTAFVIFSGSSTKYDGSEY